MRRYLLLCLLLFLAGCDSRSERPEKVERGNFEKRTLPPRPK